MGLPRIKNVYKMLKEKREEFSGTRSKEEGGQMPNQTDDLVPSAPDAILGGVHPFRYKWHRNIQGNRDARISKGRQKLVHSIEGQEKKRSSNFPTFLLDNTQIHKS